MTLDLSSLKKAVTSMEHALQVATENIDGAVDTNKEDVIRAGVIQNFEFTYELCWKFIKRWLEKNSGEADTDGLTRKELFRRAAEHHLISDVNAWFEHTQLRNETVHTYDGLKAEHVYSHAFSFAADARALLTVLENKND